MIADWTVRRQRDPRGDLFTLVHFTDESMFTGPVREFHGISQKFPRRRPKGHPFYIAFLAKFDRKQRALIRKSFPAVTFRGQFAFLNDTDMAMITMVAE